MQFLMELADVFLPKGYVTTTSGSEHMWRQRYYRALKRLESEGIETVQDWEAGADLYVYLRSKWEPYVVALAKYMDYEWSAIAPSDSGTFPSDRWQRQYFS